MQDKVLQMIGLAERAGKIRSGGFETEDAVRRGKARLVIITEDAMKNTVSKFTDLGYSKSVPVVRYGTKETLGHCIGKEERSCLAITDENLAGKISELLSYSNHYEETGNGDEESLHLGKRL